MPSTYSRKPRKIPLVWDPSWFHRSESIYGLACKLGTANSARIEEALDYLSMGLCGPIAPAYRDWIRDFDAIELLKKIGGPAGHLKTSVESLPDWFYQGTNGALDDFYYRSLRYCPLCLQQSFHSINHQCRLIRHCPVHAQDLIELCPHCHELINPFCGKPWHCTSCHKPLVDLSRFPWIGFPYLSC